MDRSDRQTAVLLINLGTPDSPSPRDLRRYLREFLSDPRVLDMNRVARWALLHLVILPLRPRTSGRAYSAIWTEQGSPLLIHGEALRRSVATELGDDFQVELGMRYGKPSIRAALERLLARSPSRILLLPLFPQYSAAATASALAKVYEELGGRWDLPPVTSIGPFYAHPGFIGTLAGIGGEHLEEFRPDHVLFSFHGLPERQLRRSDPSGGRCLAEPSCCDAIVADNRSCYRAQCFATARALADALDLEAGTWSVSFQSRLGRTPWIQPYTDHRLPELAKSGVKRLAVFCPAFVADCLETLEEIGIRAREQWKELGGEELHLVPCANSHPQWVRTVAEMLRAHASPHRSYPSSGEG
jgi:ferrochelatase